MRVLLVSSYEMGHQPIGLASPAAALGAAGHEVTCLDLAVASGEADALAQAELVGVSVPMHTAARLGIEFARRLRQVNNSAKVVFYGLYASPLYDRLVDSGLADFVFGGEYEPGLVALAGHLSDGQRAAPEIPGAGRQPAFDRQKFLLPDRSGLPGLEHYARLKIGDQLRLVGYVEASRGCAHTCRHCPITPVYGGRLRLVQPEVVLADIDQLVALGADHITFGDPDFFNALPHSFAILEELHRRHLHISFDATIKVEHLLEHAARLPSLRDFGCSFITSAFESTDDDVLGLLAKGHTRKDMELALAQATTVGLVIRPTWVAFTPWTTVQGFVDLLDFVERHGLVANVQPVQYGLRLLLPPGSPLVEVVAQTGVLGAFDDERLTYIWTGPDRCVDDLQAEVAGIVEAAALAAVGGNGPSGLATFTEVKRAALRALTGRDVAVDVAPQPGRPVPGLTEAWFC